jgi:pyrroloquinoline quinone biosynthesis protein D
MTARARLAADARPRLARHARLRPDPRSGRTVLLYPERALFLNDTAAAILAACDGRSSLPEIAARVAAGRAVEADRAAREVLAFCQSLADRGLLEPS